MKSAKKYMSILAKNYMIPDRLPLIAISTYLSGYFFGKDGLAVHGFLMPLYFMFSIVGFVINAGSLTLAMRAINRFDSERSRQISSAALFFSIVIGLVLMILTWIFLDPIVTFLGVPAELHALAMDYAQLFPILGFFLIVSNYAMQFMKIVGLQTQFRLIYKILLVFNGIAIYFCAKILDLGIQSVAIGMLVATIIFLIYGAIQLKKYFHSNLFAPIDFSNLELGAIFQARSALTISKIGLLLQTVLYNHILMLTLGIDGVAVYAGMRMAIQLCRTGSDMSLQPIAPVLTIELGDKNLPACLLMFKTAIQRGLVFAILFSVGILALTEHEAYKFYVSSLIPAAISAIFIAAYLPMRHEIFANIIALLRTLIIPGAFLIWAYHNDPSKVWWSFPVAEFGTLIFIVLGMKFLQKLKNLKTPLLLDLTTFPKSIFFVVNRDVGLTDDQKSKISNPKILEAIEEWIKLSREHSDLNKNNFTSVQISDDKIVLRSTGQRFDYREVIPSSRLKDFDWSFKFVLGLSNLYIQEVKK